jgi:hypothetical protein
VVNATPRPLYSQERDPVPIVKHTGNGFVAERRIAIFVYIDGILLTIFNGERLYS